MLEGVTIAHVDVKEPSNPTDRFVVLDGLRGLAAFAVIVDHVPSELFRTLLPGRYLAVDFFFVLSGFVLCHAYGARLKAQIRTLGFMHIRFVRLYPMYLFGLGLGLSHFLYFTVTGYNESSWGDLAAITAISLLFLPVPSIFAAGENLYPLNPPSWSLFAELLANLFYAAIAPWLTWRMLCVLLLLGALAVTHLVPSESDLGAGWKLSDMHIGVVRAVFGFFAGVAIYRSRQYISLPSLPVWFAVGLFLFVLSCPVPEAFRRWFDTIACLVFLPAIVCLVQNAVVTGVSARIASWLGLVSYGVYMVHEPIYRWFQSFGAFFGIAETLEFVAFPIIVVLSGLIAWLAHGLFDKPVRNFLNRLYRPS